jgi:hypothetical protein
MRGSGQLDTGFFLWHIGASRASRKQTVRCQRGSAAHLGIPSMSASSGDTGMAYDDDLCRRLFERCRSTDHFSIPQ